MRFCLNGIWTDIKTTIIPPFHYITIPKQYQKYGCDSIIIEQFDNKYHMSTHYIHIDSLQTHNHTTKELKL